jgi:phosphatidylglycerol:prolipoprotein diacylglycerol transferase
MHPILFRIPLPNMPLRLWWLLAVVATIALASTALSLKKADRSAALVAFVVGVSAAIGAVVFRGVEYTAANIPIYSYGVMLGLSLVVGWYLTLGLAERDGLPKETMANCYVVTAIAAIVGARLLYIVTNLDEFNSFADLFALRRGGLVAYGGFLGGFLGSWVFLARHRIRLMPWADAAVPSLASGLLITRIGCYLFGCDFGKRLPETAPGWLKSAGTFPHWPTGTLEGGDGSPAFVRHLDLYRGSPLGDEVVRLNHSLPVHPTQIYEALVGLTLLVVLFAQRRALTFRGQVFLVFVYGYGLLRFLLEILRDDVERGEWGPTFSEHMIIPGALFFFAIAFVVGISLGITNLRARTFARVLAFLPPIVAYLVLRPPSFGASVAVQLSTSQWIALVTALLAAGYYARFWQEARTAPVLAMSLGDFEPATATSREDASDEADDSGKDDEDEETQGASAEKA